MADVVQADLSARVRLEKNSGVVLYDQSFNPANDDIDQHSGQTIQIASSSSATLSIGGITVVKNALLQADGDCEVRVNGQAAGASLVGTSVLWAAFGASITSIKVVNDFTTTITVQYVATD